MTYYSDDEEDFEMLLQIEREKEFDRVWDEATRIFEDLENEDPRVYEYLTVNDIFNYLENGKELPQRKQKKYNPYKDNIGYIPEPIDMTDWEPLDTRKGWVTIKSSRDLRKEELEREKNKDKIEEEERKKQEEERKKQELIELKKKAEANKFNWTISKELRGIKPKPKPEQPKKSKSARRKNRRKFKVNKNNLNENNNKPKSKGFQVRRVIHKYE